MTSNWKTMRNTLVWLLVAVITMGIVVSSPYLMKSRAASLPTVKSCKGLTVKKVGNDWVTVNASGNQVSYTGVASNSYGWWRVENGKVNFKANGVYSNDYGWWDVEGGKVNFNGNSIYSNSYGWWKCTGGKVTFNENGVFNNKFGWWKVQNSKVDFSFTGIAGNQYGDWYLENGKVQFDKTGSVKYNGKNYYVVNGKVSDAAVMNTLIHIVEDAAAEDDVSKGFVKHVMTDKETVKELAEIYEIDAASFTSDNVDYAISKADVDWANEAYSFCLNTLSDDNDELAGLSRAFLREIMVTPIANDGLGFDEASTDAALAKIDTIKNVWEDQCRAAAKFFKDDCEADEFTKESLQLFLTGMEFTDAQVTTVVNEYFPGK